MVTNAHVNITGAADATRTVNVGFDGGNELINAGSIASVAVITDGLSVPLATGTGKTLSIKPNVAITQGVMTLVVEFIDYKTRDGSLLKVT